jgi:hypothetical protein
MFGGNHKSSSRNEFDKKKTQTRIPNLGLNCDPEVAPTPDRPPGVGRPFGRGLLSRRLSPGLQYNAKRSITLIQLTKKQKKRQRTSS